MVRPLTERIYGTGAKAFAARNAATGGMVTGYILVDGIEEHPLNAAHIAELRLLFPSCAWEGAPGALGLSLNDMRERGRLLPAAWAEFARGGTVRSLPETRMTFSIRSSASARPGTE